MQRHLTVKEAIELCNSSPCGIECPVKKLCDATVYDKATLAEQYKLMNYEDDMLVKDVVNVELAEFEARRDALQELDILLKEGTKK